jgi:hypothetical protein
VKVGDLVKYRSRFGHEVLGLIVESCGVLVHTEVWNIQRIKSGHSGRPIREHTLQGDILEVINESR